MIEDIPLDSPESRQAYELTKILRRDWLPEDGSPEASVMVGQKDGRLLVWFSAVSSITLGVMLAKLSRPEELADPESLSCRVAIPWNGHGSVGLWKYEMGTTRFLDGTIVIAMRIYLPFGDLPEVIARLGGGPA